MNFIGKLVAVTAVKSALRKFASDNDAKTTLLGVLASGILAADIDFGKLFTGDVTEITKAVSAVVALLLGFYTNRPDKEVSDAKGKEVHAVQKEGGKEAR